MLICAEEAVSFTRWFLNQFPCEVHREGNNFHSTLSRLWLTEKPGRLGTDPSMSGHLAAVTHMSTEALMAGGAFTSPQPWTAEPVSEDGWTWEQRGPALGVGLGVYGATCWGVKHRLLCPFAQSCLPLCNHVDCSLPGSSIHGILQARILEGVVISFSRGSSQPKDQTQDSCIGRLILYHWTTWEAHRSCTTCKVLVYIETVTFHGQHLIRQ